MLIDLLLTNTDVLHHILTRFEDALDQAPLRSLLCVHDTVLSLRLGTTQLLTDVFRRQTERLVRMRDLTPTIPSGESNLSSFESFVYRSFLWKDMFKEDDSVSLRSFFPTFLHILDERDLQRLHPFRDCIPRLSLHPSGLILQTVPDLTWITNLLSLDLGDLCLADLPESIGSLSKLEELHVQSNILSTFPDSIGNLKSLTFLDASFNTITRLPDSFGSIPRLETIWMKRNYITRLPDTFPLLSSLKSASFHENLLGCLPETIGDLSNLESFSLGHNRLNSLPRSFGILPKLACLNLSYNEFTTFPSCVSDLPRLKELFFQQEQEVKFTDQKRVNVGTLHMKKIKDIVGPDLIVYTDVADQAMI